MTETYATHELPLETPSGERYTGRVTGRLIAEERDVQVLLTDDERVIVYDGHRLEHQELDEASQLRDWLSDGLYVQAMRELGEEAIVDL